ncbi:carph-isopro domain-containing protein [Blastomonas sp. CCH2-A2]|uniref:carph-isopro domain-containing protein n=1 Tax=Blastomonas sp. CCH2-A2 TaxID=1768788 RepID=UPI0018D205C4|nr:hypothetical protein [Blastomonas sp. CCH2-A2]
MPTIIAIANIGTFELRITSDYRILRHMKTESETIIDGLGGTSAVARLIEAPVSTVHSWRKIGIPPSRLAHLRLAAAAKGVPWPIEQDAAA